MPQNKQSNGKPGSTSHNKINWRSRIVGHGKIRADQVTPHPNNPRKHPQKQRDAVAASFDALGSIAPIVINQRNGYLVDGEERTWLALAQGDETELDVVYVDLSDDEHALALATFDWMTYLAEYDRDVLDNLLREVNTDDASLQAVIAELAESVGLYEDVPAVGDPGAQHDRAEELREKWQCERGQLWVIPSAHGGEHRLLCGDSTSADDVARVMGEDRAEMVWTDPPYGVAIGDKNKMLNAIAPSNRVEENLINDTLDEPGLINMLSRCFDCSIDICTPGAAWYVAAPARPLHVLFGQALKDRGIWRQTIQWVKNNATFSPLGVDYHWRCEPIFYGWLPNGGHRYYGGRQQDTVWEIDRPVASPEHPTMKPVELVARAVGNSSKQHEVAYDPFGGSGTTMVACEQLARQCRMIEIEPKYCAVILERMAGMGLEPRLVD